MIFIRIKGNDIHFYDTRNHLRPKRTNRSQQTEQPTVLRDNTARSQNNLANNTLNESLQKGAKNTHTKTTREIKVQKNEQREPKKNYTTKVGGKILVYR